MIDCAIHEMLSKTNETALTTLSPHCLTGLVQSLHNVVQRYAHYPDRDLESTRKKVHKYTDKVISACDDRLNQALTFKTFDQAKEIDKMLAEFGPIKDYVAESFHLLDIHLNRIWKWDSKKFNRAALQPYEQEKEELQTTTIAKMAHKQEQRVFKALEETYKLDQVNESTNCSVKAHRRVLRQHSLVAETSGRSVHQPHCSVLARGAARGFQKFV